jgi:hypothetical protein
LATSLGDLKTASLKTLRESQWPIAQTMSDDLGSSKKQAARRFAHSR